MKRALLLIGILAATCFLNVRSAAGQEPGWWGVVVADPTTREQIERTDIRERPYRPFHFYGNTIRRVYYRGNPLPAPRDFVNGVRALRRRS